MKWGEGASGNGFLALQRDTEFCHYLDKLSRTAVVNCIWDLESSEMAGVPQPVVGPVKTSLL